METSSAKDTNINDQDFNANAAVELLSNAKNKKRITRTIVGTQKKLRINSNSGESHNKSGKLSRNGVQNSQDKTAEKYEESSVADQNNQGSTTAFLLTAIDSTMSTTNCEQNCILSPVTDDAEVDIKIKDQHKQVITTAICEDITAKTADEGKNEEFLNQKYFEQKQLQKPFNNAMSTSLREYIPNNNLDSMDLGLSLEKTQAMHLHAPNIKFKSKEADFMEIGPEAADKNQQQQERSSKKLRIDKIDTETATVIVGSSALGSSKERQSSHKFYLNDDSPKKKRGIHFETKDLNVVDDANKSKHRLGKQKMLQDSFVDKKTKNNNKLTSNHSADIGEDAVLDVVQQEAIAQSESDTILSLCKNKKWHLVEQLLREVIIKGSSEILQADKVHCFVV